MKMKTEFCPDLYQTPGHNPATQCSTYDVVTTAVTQLHHVKHLGEYQKQETR
jgi:hypothetical protein